MKTLIMIKNTLLKVFGGFGLWILLILFNTRSGETGLNCVKVLLDVIIAVMIVSKTSMGRKVAIGIAIASTISTWLHLAAWTEVLLLMSYLCAGVLVLLFLPEEDNAEMEYMVPADQSAYWEDRNRFNPLFEKYCYSPDKGINIQKGILRKEYINIPTNYLGMRIDQTFFQRLMGLCDISFFNKYSGHLFGDDILHNVKYHSAEILRDML